MAAVIPNLREYQVLTVFITGSSTHHQASRKMNIFPFFLLYKWNCQVKLWSKHYRGLLYTYTRINMFYTRGLFWASVQLCTLRCLWNVRLLSTGPVRAIWNLKQQHYLELKGLLGFIIVANKNLIWSTGNVHRFVVIAFSQEFPKTYSVLSFCCNHLNALKPPSPKGKPWENVDWLLSRTGWN